MKNVLAKLSVRNRTEAALIHQRAEREWAVKDSNLQP